MHPEETKIYLAIIITVIVLGIIIGFFAISVISHQRRNIALQKAYMTAEISAMEKERERLALDMHDDIGPLLTVVKFQVNHVEPGNPEEKDLLEQASTRLDHVIMRMREVANNLMPGTLERKGLITTLKEFFNAVESTGKIKIFFEHPVQIELERPKALSLFRVLQEIVNNCLKHSGATELQVRIEEQAVKMEIMVRDNGSGFDHASIIKEGKGLGLQSIRNRIELIGGKLTVESKINVGTAYLLEIPKVTHDKADHRRRS